MVQCLTYQQHSRRLLFSENQNKMPNVEIDYTTIDFVSSGVSYSHINSFCYVSTAVPTKDTYRLNIYYLAHCDKNFDSVAYKKQEDIIRKHGKQITEVFFIQNQIEDIKSFEPVLNLLCDSLPNVRKVSVSDPIRFDCIRKTFLYKYRDQITSFSLSCMGTASLSSREDYDGDQTRNWFDCIRKMKNLRDLSFHDLRIAPAFQPLLFNTIESILPDHRSHDPSRYFHLTLGFYRRPTNSRRIYTDQMITILSKVDHVSIADPWFGTRELEKLFHRLVYAKDDCRLDWLRISIHCRIGQRIPSELTHCQPPQRKKQRVDEPMGCMNLTNLSISNQDLRHFSAFLSHQLSHKDCKLKTCYIQSDTTPPENMEQILDAIALRNRSLEKVTVIVQSKLIRSFFMKLLLGMTNIKSIDLPMHIDALPASLLYELARHPRCVKNAQDQIEEKKVVIPRFTKPPVQQLYQLALEMSRDTFQNKCLLYHLSNTSQLDQMFGDPPPSSSSSRCTVVVPFRDDFLLDYYYDPHLIPRIVFEYIGTF